MCLSAWADPENYVRRAIRTSLENQLDQGRIHTVIGLNDGKLFEKLILVAYCNFQIVSILFLKEAFLMVNHFQFCTIQFIDLTYVWITFVVHCFIIFMP